MKLFVFKRTFTVIFPMFFCIHNQYGSIFERTNICLFSYIDKYNYHGCTYLISLI